MWNDNSKDGIAIPFPSLLSNTPLYNWSVIVTSPSSFTMLAQFWKTKLSSQPTNNLLQFPLAIPSTLTRTHTTSSPQPLKFKRNHNPNISLLQRCTHLREAKQIHARMIISSQISNTLSASRLAEFYSISDNGNLPYAEKIINSVKKPQPFVWNALIRGNLKQKSFLKVLLLHHQMFSQSVQPDHYTFTFVLKACTHLPALGTGKQLHCQIVKLGFGSGGEHMRLWNKLIHLYASLGVVEDARNLFDTGSELSVVTWNSMLDCYAANRDRENLSKLFDEMPERDVVSWNIMIAFYVEVGEFKEATEVFAWMQDSGERPDRVTFISVLSAVAHLGVLAQGKWIHEYICKNQIWVDENLGSALVNMYGKCGCLEGAFQAFEEVKKKGLNTWNAMINCLAANSQSLLALNLFARMESVGIRPNEMTFASVLNACSHGGLVDEGLEIFRKITNVYHIEPNITHYGCMVDLFGRAGLFDKAKEMIETMPLKPDVVIWKSLSTACRIHRNFEMGELAGLRVIELDPDNHSSYVLLSNIYAIVNDWNGVQRVRKMMRDRGIEKPPGCSSVELDEVAHLT